MQNKPVLVTSALLLLMALLLLTGKSAIVFSLVTCGAGLLTLLYSEQITRYYMAHPPYEGLRKIDNTLVRFAFISFGIAIFMFGVMAFLFGSTNY